MPNEILGPSGLPATPSATQQTQGIKVKATFNPASWLSAVSIEITTDKGKTTILLDPEQATQLGLRLITEAKASLLHVVAVKMMVEMGEIEIAQAVPAYFELVKVNNDRQQAIQQAKAQDPAAVQAIVNVLADEPEGVM